MMRIPSLEQTRNDAARTLRRFPSALGCAALGTISAISLINHEGPSAPTILFKVLFAAILGLPLLTSIVLMAERSGRSGAASLLWQGIGILLLGAYSFSVPMELDGAPVFHVQRLVMLTVALCGLLLVGPYLRKGQINGFWQYGKSLLFRFLLAGLYSATLFAGLTIALAALDNLFGIDVPGKRYPQLWVFIVGLFATWFFLAGVPDDLETLENETEYPKGLKVFVQYVLLPLMFVYLAILYAYLGKIVIEWEWPRGWVGGLTLSFAAAGIATLLLLHPIRERTENKWIKAATRWFWAVMIPPIVMLILAVTRRVSEYGITEARYIGYVLGFWLAAMALYFLFSRGKNIKAIPGSLAAVALLISFGPWGAFQVSAHSQIDRLQAILAENEILVNAKVRKAPEEVSKADAIQISSIISYLREVHGYAGIAEWFADSREAEPLGSGPRMKDPAEVTKLMGVEYRRDIWWEGRTHLELVADPSGDMEISGYDRMLIGRRFHKETENQPDSSGALSCLFDTSSLAVTLVLEASSVSTDSLQFPLGPLADTLAVRYGESIDGHAPPREMALEAVGARLKAKICLRRIQYRGEKGAFHPYAFEADILYSLVDQERVQDD